MSYRVKGKIVQVVVIERGIYSIYIYHSSGNWTIMPIFLETLKITEFRYIYMNVPLYILASSSSLSIHSSYIVALCTPSFHDRPAIPFHGNQRPVTKIQRNVQHHKSTQDYCPLIIIIDPDATVPGLIFTQLTISDEPHHDHHLTVSLLLIHLHH